MPTINPIALPDNLARQIAARDQAQQEAAALVNAMTCSVYERLVVASATEYPHTDEELLKRFHACARVSKLAAQVFTQEFFRQVPQSAA